jgi:hypothetical protein
MVSAFRRAPSRSCREPRSPVAVILAIEFGVMAKEALLIEGEPAF